MAEMTTIEEMPILQWPRDSALLRRRARAIREDEFGTPQLVEFSASLALTMIRAKGMGLASTQVAPAPGGEPWRMFAFFESEADAQYSVICNPEILHADRYRLGDEGCLSFASVPVAVMAPQLVQMRFRTTSGSRHEVVIDGIAARAVWHETRHLDGRVLIDRLGTMSRRLFMKEVLKARR